MKAQRNDLHSLMGAVPGDKASSWWHIAAVFSGLEFLYTGLSMTAHESSERTICQHKRTAARPKHCRGGQKGWSSHPAGCVDSFKATQPELLAPIDIPIGQPRAAAQNPALHSSGRMKSVAWGRGLDVGCGWRPLCSAR